METCSFSEKLKTGCGDFRGTEKGLLRLTDCKADISEHLRTTHLSKIVGNIEEYELILYRAGFYDLSLQQKEKLLICPKHRHNLGRNWQPLRTCQHPLHTGKRLPPKNRNVINLETSKAIHLIFGITVPIGSGTKSQEIFKKFIFLS